MLSRALGLPKTTEIVNAQLFTHAQQATHNTLTLTHTQSIYP